MAGEVSLMQRHLTSSIFAIALSIGALSAAFGAGGAIVVDDFSGGCVLSGTWADNKGKNPDGAQFSSAGTIGGGYHYTSSHGAYARTGRERAVFTPSLPAAGAYKVEVSYRASSNRASRVTWEVRHAKGTARKTVNQRQGSDMTWADLGTFEFAAGRSGSAAMVSDGGQSASIDAARFTPVELPPAPPDENKPDPTKGDGGIGLSGLQDALSGTTMSTSTETANAGARLDRDHPGPVEVILHAGETARVTAMLETYGPAKLRVSIRKADGSVKPWLAWFRENDLDSTPLKENGKPVVASMREVKAGDWSPKRTVCEHRAAEGDVIILELTGRFGKANPILTLDIRK